MKNDEKYLTQTFQPEVNEEITEPEGYPVYPENEDIYNRFKKERSIDPEDITKTKELVITRKESEVDLSENFVADDLDIPGIVVDDVEEVDGIEDEENDFFSIGGDDHIDLEENLGY
ncbi:MAG: hypothetical protein PHT07_22935 [Paludibacter sp.]|nr:hypothetical protein [Paludibacter sp.]